MPTEFLYNLEKLDPSHVDFGIDDIRRINPHRHEFEQLTGILRMIPEEGLIIGFREIQSDEFWVRGHIPGNPIFPGVLMLEAAAQLCSFYHGETMPADKFFGFGKIDNVVFRETVVPGDRLILIAKVRRATPKFAVFNTQGIVGKRLVFAAQITGVRVG